MDASDPKSSLLALFDREFSDDALSEILERDAGHLRAHLEAALLGPARGFVARDGKRFRARLVEIGWSLAGASAPMPTSLPLVVELVHAGSLIVDDIEDGSTHRRGELALHEQVGTPLALNTGNWLYFWPFELLRGLKLAPGIELDVRQRMTRAIHRSHFGQALDLHLAMPELAQAETPAAVRAISRLKTGELMQLAAALGIAAAGAPTDRVDALARFGLALGIGLQMLDDLGNLDGARDPKKRHEDLKLGRATWPWAWLAERMDTAAFSALQDDARRVRAGEADPGPLAAALRSALRGTEAALARAHLERGFDALQRDLGPSADLSPLRDEIRRLEGSYA